MQLKEVQKKCHQTKKANGSYGKSKMEDQVFEILVELFENVIRQEPINGWAIDFFLPDLDLYIQFDGNYYHGLDRPIEKIMEFKTVTDKMIYRTRLKDQEQNKWFSENNIKLLRLTESYLFP
jgi:very-short-patch-repair endonuclease